MKNETNAPGFIPVLEELDAGIFERKVAHAQEATSAWVEHKLRTELADRFAGVYVGQLSIGKP